MITCISYSEPMQRPSFSSILEYLRQLIAHSSYQEAQRGVPQLTSLCKFLKPQHSFVMMHIVYVFNLMA